MNTDGISTWRILFGSGATDPNGLQPGMKGALWNQIPGDGSAVLWTNVDGGTTWV